MGSTEQVDYMVIIADLEAKRAALDAAIAAFRTALSLGALGQLGDASGVVTNTVVPFSGSGGDVPVGAFLGKSIPEAAKVCLQIVKRKLTSRDIAEYLKKGGIETTAKNFPSLVHSILIRASRAGSGIVKLDRSFWALAEWYPSTMRTSGLSEKRSYKRISGRRRKSEPSAEPKQKKQSSGAVSRITEALRSKPDVEFSAEDIAEPASVAVPVARLMLGRLVAQKVAEKTSGGKYKAATA
jgi:hypothetical protein